MYLSHFSLKEFPFRTSPDSRFLFLSDQVNETLQKCLYMIENRIGPLYVSGPIGTGKTTLAHRLRSQLEQQGSAYTVAWLVVPPGLTANALLRTLMDEFSVKTTRSYSGSLANFAAWLREEYQAGSKPVVILDEAQNLTPTLLKLVHFLLNYETSQEKLLQLALFGQSQLADRIERFPELKSRMYPAALTALTREDTASMMRYRWLVAGGANEPPFAPAVIDDIFRLTLGLPREIVKICDLALLRAAAQKRVAVTSADVITAGKELTLARE